MKHQETCTLDTCKRVKAFGEKHAGDFPSDSLGGQQFAKVSAAVPATGAYGAQQVSGAGTAHSGVLTKGTARLLLHGDLAAINNAAHSLALLGATGLDAKFRMPRSGSEQALLDTARAFAKDALPLKTQFLSLKLPANFLENLTAHTTAFEAAGTTKSDGVGDQVGGTTGIGTTLHDAVIALHVLDTLVRNTYANNPMILAEWLTASHVERVSHHAPQARARARHAANSVIETGTMSDDLPAPLPPGTKLLGGWPSLEVFLSWAEKDAEGLRNWETYAARVQAGLEPNLDPAIRAEVERFSNFHQRRQTLRAIMAKGLELLKYVNPLADDPDNPQHFLEMKAKWDECAEFLENLHDPQWTETLAKINDFRARLAADPRSKRN